MPRYVFSQGKITVEDGVYTPAIRRDPKPERRRVIILIPLRDRPTTTESSLAQEQTHVPTTQA